MTEPYTNNDTVDSSQKSLAASGSRTHWQRAHTATRAGTRFTLRWTILLLAVVLILLAMLMASARVGLPFLASYKGSIESRLGEYLNSPVEIGELHLRWEGFGPRLSAVDVSVTETGGRQVSVDELLIDINLLKSAARGMPVINELILVGAELELDYAGDGEFRLHGVELPQRSRTVTTQQDGLDVMSWLLTANRVGLQDANVTFVNTDDQHRLEVSKLNVMAINNGKLHQLRVDMQLPESLGGRLEMGIDLQGERQTLKRADSDFYLKASGLQADALRSIRTGKLERLHASTTGIARLDATIQLELWGKVQQGKLQSARGQLTASDLVDVYTGQTILDNVVTDVLFSNTEPGWQVTSDKIDLVHRGETTSIADVVYRYKPASNTAWQLETAGSRLSLGLATRLTLAMFADDAQLPRARWLSQASPTGTLIDWTSSFSLTDGKPVFSLNSEIDQLQLQSASGIPGVQNLGATIDMQHNVGRVELQGKSLIVDIPAAYKAPLKLDAMTADLDIDMSDALRTSIIGRIDIEDKALVSSNRIEVNLAQNKAPSLFVQGRFSLDDISQAPQYLPTKLFRAGTTRWLDRALLGGRASNGEVLMFGNPADFPFKNNEGVFKFGFDHADVTLNYLRSWPALTRANGRFDINGVSLTASANDGYIDSMRVAQAEASIENLTNARLKLHSTSAGPLADIVRFARTGPLKQRFAAPLVDLRANGVAQMDLVIEVPLRTPAPAVSVAAAQAGDAPQARNTGKSESALRVNGSLFLSDNDLQFENSKLSLRDVDGAITFSETGFRMNNVQAIAYDQPVTLNSNITGSGRDRINTLSLRGVVGADEVLQNYDIPMGRFVAGRSLWNVALSMPLDALKARQDGVVLTASSDLVGTQVLLPAPLAKQQASVRDIRIGTVIKPDEQGLVWSINYGNRFHSLVRADDGMQSFAAKFGPGRANANVDQGIRLEGTVPRLPLDQWVKSIAAFIDDLEPSAKPEPILPISAKLNTTSLLAGVESLGPASIRVNTDDAFINTVINNQWINASTRYPRAHWRPDEPALVRIASIDKRFFDALDSAPAPAVADKLLDPRELPPLRIRVSRLRWDLLDLKDLSIRTSPTISGLNIDTFGFATRDTQLIGNGYWRLRDPQGVNAALTDKHVSKLNLTMQSSDFGSALTHLGFGGTLDEGEGQVSGSLAWSGPAYKPSLGQLDGEMDIELARGRILKVDPGAARLVGLFALQTIPRRLNLDFKDLVNNGLDYETIAGKVQLANGIAHAPLVQLSGSIGVVDVTGESNLLTREYNQKLTVLPRVSAALPVIGIISGGATAGLGALFAGGFLKAIGLDLDRIGLREYSLTGSWDSPKLTNIPFSQ